MKKLVASVLILALLLTMTASAAPVGERNNHQLSPAEMSSLVGGVDGDCVVAAIGTASAALGYSAAAVFFGPVGWLVAGAALFASTVNYAYKCANQPFPGPH